MNTYTISSDAIVHTTSVDFMDRGIQVPVHLVQYDDRLPIIEVSLFKNRESYTLPSSAEANIRFGKKDGTFVINPVLGKSSDGKKVYVEVTLQMVTNYGCFEPIIELVVNSKIAGSGYFNVIVDRNPVQQTDVESTTEWKTIEGMVERAETAARAAEESSSAVVDMTVGATTGLPGSDASVTKSGGTGTTPVHLEFSIPRGSSGVELSSMEPTDPTVNVWIDPTAEGDIDTTEVLITLFDGTQITKGVLTWENE